MPEQTPMHHPSVPPPPTIRLERGSFVVDTRDGRIGRVVDREGPRLYLRPLGGGIEWTAGGEDLRCPTEPEMETIRAVMTPVSRTVP